ncbi:DUF7536 family protein [Halegenticoccus tardaugens]|uniref:DUF7536 family protein n=1 Tax=Halegenticoccus tardaugens TaxID=2071624 RepID=UPI00100ADF7C|nr:hypothetical protein [Halegenticoccus tardaugens]
MSDDVPERPPARGLLDALSVRRNAKIGAAVGLLVAVSAYLFRVFEVIGPFPGTQEFFFFGPGVWFLLLAFVLATTSAMLVAAALTVVSIYRLAREL